MFDEEYKLWNSSLHNLIHHTDTYSFLDVKIDQNILFIKALLFWFCLQSDL